GTDGRTVVIQESAFILEEEAVRLTPERLEALKRALTDLVLDLARAGLRFKQDEGMLPEDLLKHVGVIDGEMVVLDFLELERAKPGEGPCEPLYEDVSYMVDDLVTSAVARGLRARTDRRMRTDPGRRLAGGAIRRRGEVALITKQATRVKDGVSVSKKATTNVKPWMIVDMTLDDSYTGELIQRALDEQRRFDEHKDEPLGWNWIHNELERLRGLGKDDSDEEVRRLLKMRAKFADGWKDMSDPAWKGPPRLKLVRASEMESLIPAQKEVEDHLVLANNCFSLTVPEGREIYVDQTGRVVDRESARDRIRRENLIRISGGSLVRIASYLTVYIGGEKYYVLQGKQNALKKKGIARYQPYGGHMFFKKEFFRRNEMEHLFDIEPEDPRNPLEMACTLPGKQFDKFMELFASDMRDRTYRYFEDPLEVLRRELLEELTGHTLDERGRLIPLSGAGDHLRLISPEAFLDKLDEFDARTRFTFGGDITDISCLQVADHLRYREGYRDTIYRVPPLGTDRPGREGDPTVRIFERFDMELTPDEQDALRRHITGTGNARVLLVTKEFLERARHTKRARYTLSDSDGIIPKGLMGRQVTLGDNLSVIPEDAVSDVARVRNPPDVPQLRISAAWVSRIRCLRHRESQEELYLVSFDEERELVSAVSATYDFDGDDGRMIYEKEGVHMRSESARRRLNMRQFIPQASLSRFLRLFNAGVGREISPLRKLRRELVEQTGAFEEMPESAPLEFYSFNRYKTPDEVFVSLVGELLKMDVRPNFVTVLGRAYKLAAESHARADNAVRDDDRPYIFHPLEIAHFAVVELGITDESAILAAILHDVVEDTVDNLPEGVDNIRALTREILEREKIVSFGQFEDLPDILTDLTEAFWVRNKDGRLRAKIEHLDRVEQNGRRASIILTVIDRWHNIMTNESEDTRKSDRQRFMEEEEVDRWMVFLENSAIPGALRRFMPVYLERERERAISYRAIRGREQIERLREGGRRRVRVYERPEMNWQSPTLDEVLEDIADRRVIQEPDGKFYRRPSPKRRSPSGNAALKADARDINKDLRKGTLNIISIPRSARPGAREQQFSVGRQMENIYDGYENITDIQYFDQEYDEQAFRDHLKMLFGIACPDAADDAERVRALYPKIFVDCPSQEHIDAMRRFMDTKKEAYPEVDKLFAIGNDKLKKDMIVNEVTVAAIGAMILNDKRLREDFGHSPESELIVENRKRILRYFKHDGLGGIGKADDIEAMTAGEMEDIMNELWRGIRELRATKVKYEKLTDWKRNQRELLRYL
ncbi:hypothetical protein ACFL42_04885, partial [Candidatus Omnitrophota bacterium]